MLNFEEVRELVPQKYPFLFIDKVIELQKESRIVCLKNISGNEPFFAGHFPDFAIMPGVLIVEALAQASIILFKKSFSTEQHKDKVFLLASANVRFSKPVFPGDQLILEIDIEKVISSAAIVKGVAKVGDKVVTKATLSFGVANKDSLTG
ncbi:MAG: 3-hydroxyacyl-ACP dehydratase FabZ [Candidatus Scalindua rubra]|uniref:3-hydroxyacyl-[acyl-carrier-protein] dehydratase n=1 Tax=Candidatus Scalindua brodae TaxID=237368 RepID=A0A0B0EHL2_9BACT|nr:MAG: beta-hydroxyacyl-(acyl-carrier-protein) dehydratase [Candidatus Scalindua brodae]MBZ0107702.1 3-hydroxyacyl-ACP dehydratase FabZ [Candidatus Scalindua rubra]TWU35540.1 3-hydroxyacyl-[acyl-carrier-protein] dehydratase FabZ [Candidatus Brocadiaceae bacterium S225]